MGKATRFACTSALAVVLAVAVAIGAPFFMNVLLTYMRYYGAECPEEAYEFTRTGIGMHRGLLSDAQREYVRTIMETQVPTSSWRYCGVDCSVLDTVAKSSRGQCKVLEFCENHPDICATLVQFLTQLGLPTHVNDAHFVPMFSSRNLNQTGDYSSLVKSVPSSLRPLVLSLMHSIGETYFERHTSDVCSSTPELCQGFPWHIDDEDLDPLVINRLYALIDKDEPRRANLRVVPRGALRQWSLHALLPEATAEEQVAGGGLARARFALYAACRSLLLGLYGMYQTLMGEMEADWWVTQLQYSLAGCTAVMEPGDVLLFSSDIYHQTQGTDADRLSLILSSCENCHLNLPKEATSKPRLHARQPAHVRFAYERMMGSLGAVAIYEWGHAWYYGR